jgi:hypothetical protein
MLHQNIPAKPPLAKLVIGGIDLTQLSFPLICLHVSHIIASHYEVRSEVFDHVARC